MLNKFKRTKFSNIVENCDGVLEYDLLDTHWDLFELNFPITHKRIIHADIGRPDYLSFRIYNNSGYWWMLCKANHIDDLWNDLAVGDIIIVPDVRDYNAFHSKVRKKVRGKK